MNLDKKTVRSIMGIIVFTLALIVLCFKISSVLDVVQSVLALLSPFLLGAAMAFIINVLMSFLEEKIFLNKYLRENKLAGRFRRPVSLFLAILIIIGLIFVVIFIVVPELGNAVTKLSYDIQRAVPEFQSWLEELLARYPQALEAVEPYLSAEPDWDAMFQSAVDFLMNGGTNILGDTVTAATQVAGTIVSSVSSFVISFIFACYILVQKEKLGRQCKRVLDAFLPDRVEHKILEVGSMCYRIFSKFIAGQCLEACILGTMFFVVLSVGKFSYALLISVVIAFFSLIPIFGAFIGCVVGAFLILTESPVRALVFVIIFLIVQQIEGNLIYPRVVGGSIGLPAIWVLAAVSLGGSLMGIAGMLIFIPLTSVFYALLRQEVRKRLSKRTAGGWAEPEKNKPEQKEKETVTTKQ